MNEHLDANEPSKTDIQRMGEWLSGDVRVSRKILVAGAAVLLAFTGTALD